MTAGRLDQDQRSRFCFWPEFYSPPARQPAAMPNNEQQRELLPNLSHAEVVGGREL